MSQASLSASSDSDDRVVAPQSIPVPLLVAVAAVLRSVLSCRRCPFDDVVVIDDGSDDV